MLPIVLAKDDSGGAEVQRLLPAIVAILAAAASMGAGPPVEKRGALANGTEALIARDLRENHISRAQAALFRTQYAFAPEKLPERYRAEAEGARPICATPLVREIWRDWHLLPDEARELLPAWMRPGGANEAIFIPKGSVRAGSVTEGILGAKTNPGDFPGSPSYDRTYATTNFLIHWISAGAGSLVQNQDSNGIHHS